jgi:hypothetical protein
MTKPSDDTSEKVELQFIEKFFHDQKRVSGHSSAKQVVPRQYQLHYNWSCSSGAYEERGCGRSRKEKSHNQGYEMEDGKLNE